ncbi:MAG TPA: DoxX family protein [Lutibacter sp.]|nr:DoxX family protein [Lutibacter sp.]
MSLKNKYYSIVDSLSNLKSLPLLLMRIILAIGFFGPAKMKMGNIQGIIDWFETINIPMPALNAYMATGTEALGVVLLILGLGTRLISIPLIITMIVAIVTVHLGNGFEAGNNGFEIPLYYIIMLFTLVIYGGGKFSVDHILNKNRK